MDTKNLNVPEVRADASIASPLTREAPSGTLRAVSDQPSRSEAAYSSPQVVGRGAATGGAYFCDECQERTGYYREAQQRWLCDPCAVANPVICESCAEHPASIQEWGYFVCGSCRSGGRA